MDPYEKTKQVEIRKYGKFSTVGLTLVCPLMAGIGFVASAVVRMLSGSGPAIYLSDFFVDGNTLGTAVGITIGFLSGLIPSFFLAKGNTYEGLRIPTKRQLRKYPEKDNKITYGTFTKDKDGIFIAPRYATCHQDPLLSEYKLEQEMIENSFSRKFVQTLTETPLGMWENTMKAIEDDLAK